MNLYMTLNKEQPNKTAIKIAIPTKPAIEELIKKAQEGKAESISTQLFDALLLFAHAARASDVHLEPEKDNAIVRLRIDGILHDEFFLPLSVHTRLISLLKIRTQMRTDEHRSPQDGRYQFPSENGGVDVRVSLMPISDGEKAVLRLLSSESHKLTLEQLGFSKNDLKRVGKAIKKSWGMILSTGPTGAGKTTSIYAILEILNKRGVNISTIEDPVEFYIPGVNQSQVDAKAKLTFASGLRSIVRQDPDIIMVGEIRDEETAKIAVNAALTGHKLLSTLHTNNAASTIPRLIDMQIEPFLIASTLIITIGQRLVRKACSDCWNKIDFTKAEAVDVLDKKITEKLFGDKDVVQVAKAVGCERCNNTGYKGRLGIFEVLEVSEEIQKLIVKKATSDEIEDKAIEEGMVTLIDDGVQKVLRLETTIEELIRVLQD